MDLVKNVFSAHPLTVERVMIEPGRGFYIPAYQRNYAWDRDNVAALLASICEGIAVLPEMDDAITFIGTFIFIHDTQYATIEPQVRGDLPQGVFLVIDGQQRLGTLSIIATCLHDLIVQTAKKVRGVDDAISTWINRNKQELLNRLASMFSLDKTYGDGAFQWYPRIIRAHDDSWSCSSTLARYNSPIAALLMAYIRRIHGGSDAAGAFEWDGGATQTHELLARNYRYVASTLRRIVEAKEAKRNDNEEPLPNLGSLAASAELHRRFFWLDVPVEVLAVWRESAPNTQSRTIQQMSRLFMFTRYLLDRVAVTQVQATKEDYAFDLFEALNTTGEPLTAYETFKPIVIRQEQLEQYRNSPSARSLAKVEAFLNKYPEKRRQNSDRLLIPFALFETGHKLGKHLRDQRNWLRRNYELSGDESQKRDFLRDMAHVASFLVECWPDADFGDGSNLGDLDLGVDRSDVLLCLQVLRDANHEITIAVIARFYAEAIDSTGVARTQAIREFVSALKAVTAFFALWRGSRVGTDNIDVVYRSVMAGKLSGDVVEEPQELLKLCRRGGVPPRAEQLKRALQLNLKNRGGVVSRESWIEKAAALPVYSQSEELTKLLLLAASHDAVADVANAGLTKDGRPGCCEMMRLPHWHNDTVEHVAPRKRGDGEWDDEVYNKELIHTLGNLTLLPQKENSSVSNRDWLAKRLYYCLLGSEDPSDEMLAEAEALGISRPSQEILAAARFMPHVKALGLVPDGAKWDAEFVRKRAHHIASRAWRMLAAWLDLETA